jgi:bifunctional DNA-binding transcriptional regulator/antitoxin component of YhaV-PrlF toxin-antitoxin module
MKLQKQLSKIVGKKKYYKYVIVLPQKILTKLGFRAGDELKADVKGGKLVVGKR